MLEFDYDAALSVPEPEDKWVWCSGDVNAWEHGGTWFNESRSLLMAIRGLEGEGIEEIWPYTLPLPAYLLHEFEQKAALEFPDPEDINERERCVDDLTEAWQTEEAERLMALKTVPVYTWLVGHEDEDYDVASIIPSYGMSQEEWNDLPPHMKTVYVAEHYGLDEMDCSPDRLTRVELQARLGNTRLR